MIGPICVIVCKQQLQNEQEKKNMGIFHRNAAVAYLQRNYIFGAEEALLLYNLCMEMENRWEENTHQSLEAFFGLFRYYSAVSFSSAFISIILLRSFARCESKSFCAIRFVYLFIFSSLVFYVSLFALSIFLVLWRAFFASLAHAFLYTCFMFLFSLISISDSIYVELIWPVCDIRLLDSCLPAIFLYNRMVVSDVNDDSAVSSQ